MSKFVEKMVVMIVFILSMFISTFQIHSEFQGDDDYRWNRRYMDYCFWDVLPDQQNFKEYKQWTVRNLNIFFGDVHGPGVGLIYGPTIGFLSLLGLPISKEVLHLPSAIMAALSCCLLFILFRKCRISLALACVGTLLFIMSPLFVYNARGNATTWRIVIPLMQIISLIMLQNLAQGKRRATLYVGLCFLYIVMTDVLYFLSIPALVAAFILGHLSQNKEMPFTANLRDAWYRATPLLKPKVVWLPALLMIIINVAGTMAAWLWDLGYTTSFRQMLSHRGAILSATGEFPYWKAVYVQMSWLFGEITVLYLIVLIGLMLLRFVKKESFGQVEYFALIAGAGFGLIWYALTNVKSEWVGYATGYQIYILVPLIILIVFCAERLRDNYGFREGYLVSLIIPLVLSSLLTQYVVIWRYKGFLLVPEVNAIQSSSWGTRNSNSGTKAAGYLVRELFNDLHRSNWTGKVEIAANVWSNSFTTFAGLQRDGMRYRKEYGIDVVVPEKKINDLQLLIPEGTKCFDPLCIVIRLIPTQHSIDTASCDLFRIMENSTRLVSLYIEPSLRSSNDMLKPGIYQVDSLDTLFDNKYTRLSDFFYDN